MATLVTVNEKRLEVQEALRNAIMNNEEYLIERSIHFLLVEQYAKEHGIKNNDEELQLAADELRYQNELEDVEKLNQWIKTRNLTLMSLQRGIDNFILDNKIKASIPQEDIEAFFSEHRLSFDWVELYSIRVSSEEKAQELYAQITEEGQNFHLMAMEHSQDYESAKKGGYVGQLKRTQVSGEIEAAVFKAQEGEVVGPVKTAKGFNLFKVAKIGKVTLESEERTIRDILYDNLISKLRAEANIQYNIFERKEG